jgi:hypothetical protein
MCRPVLLFIGCIAIFPALVAAQHSAMSPMPAHPIALAPAPPPASAASHVSIRTQAELNSVSRLPGAHFHSAMIPARPPHRLPAHFRPMPPARAADVPVPGLGFDAVHFAATHPNDTRRNRQGRQELSFFFPFFGGMPSNSYVPAEENGEPSEAQQVAEAPQYEEPSPRSSRPRGESWSSAGALTPLDVAAPQPENQEYIFVRSDGTVFFAIAFSWDRDMLRYVTREGLRQSAARGSLDLDATRQFNEQRGLSFRPAT